MQHNGYAKVSPSKIKTIKFGSPDDSRPSEGPSFSEVLAKSSSSRHRAKREVKQEPITPVKMTSDSEDQVGITCRYS